MTLTEIVNVYPIVSLIIISVFVTLISTLVQKYLTDQKHMKAMRARQKELQKELKDCKDDGTKMKEIQVEMMKITGTMMKSSFKPMFITFIPFILLFTWIRGIYGGEEPLLAGWFWYYFGFSIISSTTLRKLLKVA